MDKLEMYRTSSVHWRPSAVVALASSPDAARVAAAREDGSLEVWIVSPGSVGWHCQLTIPGSGELHSRVSSLVWCRYSSCAKLGVDRLLSSSFDGSIYEWDLFSLQRKNQVNSVGVSIWQMAVEPCKRSLCPSNGGVEDMPNGATDYTANFDIETSDIDDDDDYDKPSSIVDNETQRVAVACDDGCVRVYNLSMDGLAYVRSFPRVSGRALSVVWSLDAKRTFSGSSDGLIRCWDAETFQEVYRITSGLGGYYRGPELCVWSLLFLKCGAVVSGDSTGSVQFWDSLNGTLLQAHTFHKGDVYALASIVNGNNVFSAGSDGQVILYNFCGGQAGLGKSKRCSIEEKKWNYVGYKKAHTHDVRALAVALPISTEVSLPKEKATKKRCLRKPISFSYHKWAKLRVPMLLSAGDDSKIFAYPANDFTQFSPHDICPAPQRPSVFLVHDTAVDRSSLLLVQSSRRLDIMRVTCSNDASTSVPSRRSAITQLLVQIKSKDSRIIICSAISTSGLLFAYSDYVKPNLFELRRKNPKGNWCIHKKKLPHGLPFVQCMAFSADSLHLLLACCDRKIYVVNVGSRNVVHIFIPRSAADGLHCLPAEPPITRMYTSSDKHWLAAINCFGDIYIFNLQNNRQHWFVSRLNDACVTSGGFPPGNKVFVVTTSANEVYALDVDSKQLGEWSRSHTFNLPTMFREFPGEVIGMSFPPSSFSNIVIVYSARAMCLINFGMSADKEAIPSDTKLLLKKLDSSRNPKASLKRKSIEKLSNHENQKNFDFHAFRDPVLFVDHLTENSLIVMEKKWLDVIKNFDPPVDRHIFGT